MSFWLKSVNTLLDKLDDQVETVADEPQTRVASLTQRLLGNRHQSNDDDEDDEDDEDDDEGEYTTDDGMESADNETGDEMWDTEDGGKETDTGGEYADDEQDDDEEELIDFPSGGDHHQPPATPLFDENRVSSQVRPAKIEVEAAAEKKEQNLEVGGDAPSAGRLSPVQGEMLPASAPEVQMNKLHETQESNLEQNEGKEVGEIQPSSVPATPIDSSTLSEHEVFFTAKRDMPSVSSNVKNRPALDSPPPSFGTHTSAGNNQQIIKRCQKDLKKSNQDLKKANQEIQKLQKQNATLQAQLDAAQAEIQAQQDELQRAAERMEDDKARAEEEREDLIDEHEEEMQKTKEHYEIQLTSQKGHFEKQIQELRSRLQEEEKKRMQEGGDWTKELEEALQRERESLKRCNELIADKSKLESDLAASKIQQDAMDKKIESLTSAHKAAVSRERESEEKLDAALSAHKRQLNQRQEREAELESMVAELSAALTLAKQELSGKATSAPVGEKTAESYYKDRYEIASEDLENMRTELSLSKQRCDTLQKELRDVSNERASEAALAQERQREHDNKVSLLVADIARLEAVVRELKQDSGVAGADSVSGSSSPDIKLRKLMRECDQAKRQIASLSDQLIRQQDLTEASKSEILALKGRLQAAIARADAAEQATAAAAASTDAESRHNDVELGGYASSKLHRRVKRGRGIFGSAPSRSIRASVGLRVTGGGQMEKLAQTVDALDLWMLETCAVMRQEPLARLGFLIYMSIMHLWCFALVCFHTVQSEHQDLSTLTKRGIGK